MASVILKCRHHRELVVTLHRERVNTSVINNMGYIRLVYLIKYFSKFRNKKTTLEVCNLWFLCLICEFSCALFCLSDLRIYRSTICLMICSNFDDVTKLTKNETSIEWRHSSTWSREVRSSGDKIKWQDFLWKGINLHGKKSHGIGNNPSWENSHGIPYLTQLCHWTKPSGDKASGDELSWNNYIELVEVPIKISVGLHISHLVRIKFNYLL